MASSLGYVEFVMEQMSGAGSITYRRMFGEYGLYCGGKYFGLVCDDRVLVKITPAGETLVPDCPRGIPYEGGGEMFLPDVEDRETLAELVRVTCAALRSKKPRKRSSTWTKLTIRKQSGTSISPRPRPSSRCQRWCSSPWTARGTPTTRRNISRPWRFCMD